MGLGFDSAGYLYAANAANNNILRFDKDGVGSVFAGTGLNDPIGIAIQVPEPSMWATFGLGIASLTWWRCRKQESA